MATFPDKLLRPTWAEISLSTLRRNYERVRKLAGRRKVMAVVKADAYGHGAVPVAKRLAGCGVDWFGVATVEEGIELRAAGIEQPVLLLGGLYMSDPADLVEYRLTPSVSSTARLDTYAECARRFAGPEEGRPPLQPLLPGARPRRRSRCAASPARAHLGAMAPRLDVTYLGNRWRSRDRVPARGR